MVTRSYPLLPNLSDFDFEKLKTLPPAEAAKQIQMLEEVRELKEGLPHLYGFPWYTWALRYFESENKENFLCSANQISKSSTLIRRLIHRATGIAWDKEFWRKRWPILQPGQIPNQFWYMLPNLEVATIEFETKWEPLFLPKGKFKDHPIFGWKPHFEKDKIKEIQFNSGVTIYFKGYSQKVSDLQTGTVFEIGADEEMPVSILPEIQARLNATDGYFNMVFTATLGQLHWEQTMEPKVKGEEKHKDALKIQVSLYDAMFYEDGSPSHWTEEKIKRAEAKCPTEAEKQRRIYGKFVKSEGMRFQSFDRERNCVLNSHPLPRTWHVFSGVDPGSGGKSGHPAGILFLAVSPDYKHGRVYKTWRGDGVQTASSDILRKYRELRGNVKPMAQKYDYGSAEFGIVSGQQGEPFTKANKDRDAGIDLLNTLFKTGMLKIHAGESDNDKLISELCSLPTDATKNHSLDDLSDALRYAAMAVPWDFTDIKLEEENEALKEPDPKPELTESQRRRQWFMGQEDQQEESIEDELDYWNDFYSD